MPTYIKTGFWKESKKGNDHDLDLEKFVSKNKGPLQVSTILLSTGWLSFGGEYIYTVSNSNISSTSVVTVIPSNSDVDIVKAAEIYPEVISGLGALFIYAKNQPTGNISVTLNIF